MRTPKRRHTLSAVLALALSALPAVASVTPAHAVTAMQCQALGNPTPSAEVDFENDGNADVRVPSVSDLSVCVEGEVGLTGDVARIEPCGPGVLVVPCSKVLIDAEVGATLDVTVWLCRAVDHAGVCSYVAAGPWTYETLPTRTLCIGVYTGGSFPCGGGSGVVAWE
jgi:hypothetical protein